MPFIALFWTILLGLGLEPPPEGTGASIALPALIQIVESQGIEVTLRVRPLSGGDTLVAGEEAEVSFSLRDAHTGEPITGLHPLAWIHRREGPLPPSERELKDLIATFLGGLLSVRADIDLNRYYMLVLNHDASISVIDPLIEFSRTRLFQLIGLSGPGDEWRIDAKGERLYVSVPRTARLEVIDLATFRSLGFVDLGEGNEPRALALEPSGETLWVGLDSSNTVAAIETGPRKLIDRIPIGAGLHRLAIDDEGTTLVATSSGSGRVTVIDLATRSVISRLDSGEAPYAVAYSPASRLFYVGHARDGHLVAIDPATGEERARISIDRPVFDLAIDPTGRFLFAISQEPGAVTVIDLSTHEQIGVVLAVRSPDQVVFTERFAYVRNLGSPSVALIELSRLARGELIVTDLSVSRLAPSEAPRSTATARMIAPTPEGNAVMIASPADRLVYYYVEGMMASMGNFQTYSRIPRGVQILDRSLREVSPGVYSTYIRPVESGRSDVPFILDQPRLLHGFELEILPAPRTDALPVAAPVTVESLFADLRIHPGEAHSIRVRIVDSASGEAVSGLDDVQAMVIQGTGIRQDRHTTREVEPGVYEFEQSFPDRDRYQVLVRVPSRGSTFRDLPMFTISVLLKNEGKPWERPAPPLPTQKGPSTPKEGE